MFYSAVEILVSSISSLRPFGKFPVQRVTSCPDGLQLLSSHLIPSVSSHQITSGLIDSLFELTLSLKLPLEHNRSLFDAAKPAHEQEEADDCGEPYHLAYDSELVPIVPNLSNLIHLERDYDCEEKLNICF